MRDVIVIGAGGGGPVVAKELAARGLDVLLLEGGPAFPDTDTEWRHLEDDAMDLVSGYLRVGPADRSRPMWYRDLLQPSFVLQASAIGGTTTLYYGNCPRAMPGVFQGYNGPDREQYDYKHVFPFAYDEVVPYYEWVESTLPVQLAPMGTKDELFLNGGVDIGLEVQTSLNISGPAVRPQQNAILQPGGNAGMTTDAELLKFPKATGCTFCGSCTMGCYEPIGAPRNLKAKRSTDNSYVPMCVTADRWSTSGKPVTVMSSSYATQIHTEGSAGNFQASGVTWRNTNTGEVVREDAKVVVLSGGCVESPRLWLNSNLPNSNGWVGRGLTNHSFDVITGLFPFDTGGFKGPGSNSRVDIPTKGSLITAVFPPALQAAVFGTGSGGIQGAWGRGPTGEWDGRPGAVAGAFLLKFMNNLDRLINVLILTDDDVQRDNRVVLADAFQDENGQSPKINLLSDTQRTRRTQNNRTFMANEAAKILRAAGATDVIRMNQVPIVLHVQSTMRMGQSEDDSVLTSDAEAREVSRLFIADNSALANSLGGPNPTLTNQALATRTAEKIFVRYFGGETWVGKEDPVASTDPRVTQGLM